MAKKTEPTTEPMTEPMTVHTSNTGSATTDHEVIRKWAEERGGRPATVEGTERGGDAVGMIRLEFPDAPGADDDKLTEITWDEWFAKFDEGGLALLYQEHTAGGQPSNFNKLVKQETAAMATAEPVKTAARKTTVKKAASKKVAAAKKAVAKKTASKQVPVAKKGAKKVPVVGRAAKTMAAATKSTKKVPAAKKAVAKAPAKKVPVAKKTAAKKSARKVPAARGYRGR